MHKLLILSFMALAGIFFAQQSVLAQAVAPQPCDPKFYQQMSARAWLESEREIMQNQNLIFKADSVLEYTCFDRFANITAHAGGDIFTHTEYFEGRLIPRGGVYGLEVILEEIIGASMDEYLKGGLVPNFSHSYLGGRAHLAGIDMAPANSIRFSITGERPYACNVMAKVWEKAKCMNFVHSSAFEDTDSFYPFEPIKNVAGAIVVKGYTDLPDQDVRKFPDYLKCDTESGVLTWEGAAISAENRGEALYPFQSPLGEIFFDVKERTTPGLCGFAGIQTGVTVVLSGGPAHQDGVCTNPGCTYSTSGSCTASGGNPFQP